jgi:membrane protease subunit HflK
MVDTRSGSNLLYLPLDKILQQQGVVGAAPAAALPTTEVPASTGNPTPAADPRSRDGTRSRDREGR